MLGSVLSHSLYNVIFNIAKSCGNPNLVNKNILSILLERWLFLHLATLVVHRHKGVEWWSEATPVGTLVLCVMYESGMTKMI